VAGAARRGWGRRGRRLWRDREKAVSGETGRVGSDPSRSRAHSRDGRGKFRASSARPRSEAHFEVLSRARLRAVFGARWAVPG
jgi:hypothetical protein